MPHLALRLFGAYHVSLDGAPLATFRSARVQALLAYLVVESAQAHRRESLATLFWPDVPDVAAKQNLRQSLYQLRQVLGEASPAAEPAARSFLQITRDTVQFDPSSDHTLDVAQFECLLAAGEFERAADLYAGELLLEPNLESEPYQEWVTLKRERMHLQAMDALGALTDRALAAQSFGRAAGFARRQLAFEPWREQAHRQLMSALAANGDRAAALAQYEACRQTLKAELGVPPEASTDDLAAKIRAGTLRPAESTEARREPSLVELAARQDLGDAPDITNLYGRAVERVQLKRWIVEERCRFVTLIGMGGMGKTALAAQLTQHLADQFDYVIWRSLVNAPPLSSILHAWAAFFSGQQLGNWPAELDTQLALVFEQLRTKRCLIVLDNAESIMQGGDRAGHYRPGYEDYGQLFRRIGESDHRSTLLLTSREQPRECARLQPESQQLRTLFLGGLDVDMGGELLTQRGLTDPGDSIGALVTRYSGNPLALKLVAQTIRDVFDGDIHAFLSDEALIFDDIRDVLDQQFARLSPAERDILLWLAIERVPVTEAQLWPRLADTTPGPHARRTFLEALRSLQRRALLENLSGAFGLQNVVTEYLTDFLVAQIVREVSSQAAGLLHTHALLLAEAPEPVRESQRRVILQPIAELLVDSHSQPRIEAMANQLLDATRTSRQTGAGYLAGNVLNLLLQIGIDLTGFDFSNLQIRQAYLRGADLPRVDFAQADFEQSVFTDYVGEVMCVAFSPDGQTLAAGADNGVLYLWQVSPLNILQLTGIYQGHLSQYGGLAFSPDGRYLVSGSDDQTVQIWDMRTRSPVHKLRGHTGGVTCVAFHPDGRTVVSGSTDQTARVWDAFTGELLHVFNAGGQAHSSIIAGVSCSSDGLLLVTGSHDATIGVWDWHSRELRHVLRGHTGPIPAVCLCERSADSRRRILIASASFDQTVRLWDARSGAALAALTGHTAPILSTAFGPDSEVVISGSDDQTVRVWDISPAFADGPTEPKLFEHSKQVLHGHFGTINTLAIQPGRPSTRRVMASGSNDKTFRVWDADDWQPLATLCGHSKWLQALVFEPDGRLLVAGSDGQSVRVWDGRTGRGLQRLREHTSRTEKLSFRGDAAVLASAGWDRTARLWDTRRPKSLHVLRGHTQPVITCEVSPTTRGRSIAATGGLDHTVHLWDATTGASIARCHGHHDRVVSLAFDPAATLLASGCWDRRIGIWDAQHGNLLRFLEGHTAPVEGVAFHPDGRRLASGSWDKSVRIWDTRTGQTLHVLQAHTNGLEMVTFSPDGALLASCACDQLVCVWDTATGALLHTLRGHTRWVRCIAFSPDGATLASGSDDGTVRLWDMTPGGKGACLLATAMEDPYTGMTITAVTGLTDGQRTALKALGAVDR